jgi:hypothetical protein
VEELVEMAKEPTQQYYEAELARLDQDFAAGKVTPGQYELYKTRIVQAATKRKRPAAVTFLIWAGVIVAALILFWIFGAIVNNLPGNRVG